MNNPPIPAILTDQLEVARQQLALVKNDERLPVVQIDIIDGWYVDNLTLLPSDLISLASPALEFDFHLMVEDPLDYLFEIAEWGEALPTRMVIAQLERMSSQATFVEQGRRCGFSLGFALDLYTPVSEIETTLLSELSCVQVMGVEAGYQNQQFASVALETVEALVKLRRERAASFKIFLDGGVTVENYPRLREAGVEQVVVGSALWQAPDFSQAVTAFLAQSS